MNRGLGLLFLLIGTAAVVLFTVLKENGTVKAAGVFYGYSSIFVILQSVGVFTLFGCAADKTGAPRKEKRPAFSANLFWRLINVRSAFISST